MITRILALLLLTLAGMHEARAIVWGVNGHPFSAYPGVPFADQLDAAAALGASSYRVNVSHTSQFDALEVLLGLAEERELTILPVLTPAMVDLAGDPPEEIRRKAFAFAKLAATRFGDRIEVWELGNELENYAIIQPCEMKDDGTRYPCEFGAAGGVFPLDYVGSRWEKVSAALDGMSDGIAAVDPGLRRAIGTAGWGHVGAFRRMADDGIEWDISVWHAYGEDPEWAFEHLATFDRPIWVTELNHPYGSRDGEDAQAKGLADQMVRLQDLARRYDVEAVFLYELLDEPYWAPDFEAFMGLFRLVPDGPSAWEIGPTKKAFDAAREVILNPAAAEASMCSTTPADGSDRSITAVVRAAYCLVLGREPDGHGLESWSRSIDEGMLVSTFLQSMVGSEEFSARHKVPMLTDREYIRLLFETLLGRAPDGIGEEAYLTSLHDGSRSRETLVLDIVGSEEFRSKHPLLGQGG